MNKEAVFALRFVMKDFAKMRKGIDEMNKHLAQMQQNAKKASSGMDKMNTSIGKTVRSIGKFALAYFALSKVISSVFSKANESIQLNLIAQSAGVARKEVGKLGKALRAYGGDVRSAGSAYSSLTNIIGGATHGMGISEDVMRVNAMYGIGFNYGNISQDALMTEIAKSMKRLRGKGDQWAINQIASAYGIDSSMANFLATHGVGWKAQVNSQEWKDISLSDSQRLLQAQENIKAKFDIVINELLPKIADAVEGIYKIIDAVFGHLAKPNPNKAHFTSENGSYTKTGKGNSALVYNAESGEYMVFDKNLNDVYSGKNILAADFKYQKENYKPSWFDTKIVKPFWNSLGVGTPMIDRGLEEVKTNVNVIVTDTRTNPTSTIKATAGSSIE